MRFRDRHARRQAASVRRIRRVARTDCANFFSELTRLRAHVSTVARNYFRLVQVGAEEIGLQHVHQAMLPGLHGSRFFSISLSGLKGRLNNGVAEVEALSIGELCVGADTG